MLKRPHNLTLGNWRTHPFSEWSFQNVREIIAVADIKHNPNSVHTPLENIQNLGEMIVNFPEVRCPLTALLQFSHTDGLQVMKNGKLIYEWHADHFDSSKPHILFSVSKSVTAMLAGILESENLFDSSKNVIDYLPGAKGGVYENCSMRNILDMTVALDFEENYTDPESEYIQYRMATAWNPTDQTNPGPGLEEFLYSLKQSTAPHGQSFLYRSPNSDLLGLVLERAAGAPLAELLSKFLWQPMGARDDAYVTVDQNGLARAAGGICVTLRDFTRLGQLFLREKQLSPEVNDDHVLSSNWLKDTFTAGDRDAWTRGNYAQRMPDGKYRNKWYQSGDEDDSISGRGIYGQQIYINPSRSTVISRFSSSPDPLNDTTTDACFKAFGQIARETG